MKSWDLPRRFSPVAALPGVVLFLLVWLVTWFRLDFPDLVEENYGYMQFFGREVLENEPVAALLSLHMQPPLLNALAAFDLWLTPQSHFTFAVVLLLMTLISLYAVVDTLRLLQVSFVWRVVAGVLFAALPSTVVYSLYSFTTTPTLFGVSLAVWGVAIMRERLMLGGALSSLGVLVLILTRAAFLWVFAVVWIGAILVIILRTPARRKTRLLKIIPSVLMLVVILLAQAHYFSQFGLLTMSSWSGENLAKALIQSGELSLPDESHQTGSECRNSMLQTLHEGRPPLWNPVAFRKLAGCREIPSLPNRGNLAWDDSGKDGKYAFEGNHNWSEELVAAREWQKVMTRVVLSDPTQVLRMALTAGDGLRESGLGIYLGSAEDYFEVPMIREQHPLADLGGVLSLFCAPVALVVGGLGSLKKRREIECQRNRVLWFAWALIGYHIAVSTLVEYGEGMRFQAEITSVLLIVLVFGLSALAAPRVPVEEREGLTRV